VGRGRGGRGRARDAGRDRLTPSPAASPPRRRRWPRRFAPIALVVLATLTIGPYLLPLPPNPDVSPEAFARPGGRFLTVDGTRTWIQESGPPAGPAVVFLHGFGGSTFSWRETLEPVGEAGFHAIALDLRGFGLSDKRIDADYGHRAQAWFVLAAMDELDLDAAVVVGHSMGGNVAAHMALEAPERVRGLVLVDAATGPDGAGGGPGGPLLSAALHLPPVQRLARVVLRHTATPERVSALLRSAYLDPAAVTPDVEAGYLVPQRLADWDLALIGIVRDGGGNALADRFSTIATPTLVIWGDQDPWIPPSAGEEIRDALTDARLAIVADSGHLPFEEQPQAFLAALLPYLEERR
jgi:pimeloyl-ACP methyl ester carboxylesterase